MRNLPANRSGRPSIMPEVEKAVAERGGDDWLFGLLADGVPVRDIMGQLGASRNYFYSWLDAKQGRRERYKSVKGDRGDSMAEDGMRILDDLHGVPFRAEEVTLAQARARYRQWMADQLRDSGKPAVAVTIHDLHLEALLKYGGTPETVGAVPEYAPSTPVRQAILTVEPVRDE